MFPTEAAGSPRPLPAAFLPEETEDMATWVQHVLSADGWETAPALASAGPSSLAVPRPLLQRGTQVSTVKAEGSSGTGLQAVEEDALPAMPACVRPVLSVALLSAMATALHTSSRESCRKRHVI